jgi:hypothetical protein
MPVIEAAHYAQTRAALQRNRLVLHLYAGLVNATTDQLCHPGPDHTPRHEFMGAANHRFAELEALNPAHTHPGPRHLGAVAEALIALRFADEDSTLALAEFLTDPQNRTAFVHLWTERGGPGHGERKAATIETDAATIRTRRDHDRQA